MNLRDYIIEWHEQREAGCCDLNGPYCTASVAYANRRLLGVSAQNSITGFADAALDTVAQLAALHEIVPFIREFARNRSEPIDHDWAVEWLEKINDPEAAAIRRECGCSSCIPRHP